MSTLTDFETRKLIDLIKTYPTLYDSTKEGFRFAAVKNLLWHNIGMEMNRSREQFVFDFIDNTDIFGPDI